MRKAGVFLLKNFCVSTIIAISIVIICAIIYRILYSYFGSPQGIGYHSETYWVKDGCGNHLLRFVLTEYPNLKLMYIGNYCFGIVKILRVDGLNQLKTIQIGKNSFTQKMDSWGSDFSKSFHVLNCESLESIEIGEYSFSDYAGDFELKNLPKLQMLKIGSVNIGSNNFYHSSFIIRGIDMTLNT